MTVPGLVVPVDVAVVDPDLLWRVEVMNALTGLMVKDVVTVFAAMRELTPGHPAVVLLGPAGAVESADQLPELRAAHPSVRVIRITGGLPPTGPLPAWEAPLPPVRRLSLVPEPEPEPEPEPAAAPEPEPAAAAAEPASEPPAATGSPSGSELSPGPAAPPVPGAIRFERELPAGSTLDEVVRAVLAELAIARDRGARESLETSFRTIAETRIIVVTSAKGGDGATTVAANLAASLAAGGRRVGLVEGDPVFGDLAVVMALPVPQPGMAVDPETGVRLVEPARPPDTFDPIDVDALIDQVSLLDPPFEVLVIDAPAPIAHRSGLTRMADHVLLVCSAHLSSIRNGVGLVEVLGHDNLGVVVNRIGRRGMPRHELEAALRAHVVAQLPVTPELVPDRPDQPPTLAPRKTPFAREIARLADALAPLKPPAGRSD